MKISTLALLTSAAMAFFIPKYQSGTGWSMKREEETQIKGAMSSTPSTVINEGIKYSTIPGNLGVVVPKPSEVTAFPRDSPDAEKSEEPSVRQQSEDYDDSELVFIPRSVSDPQESENYDDYESILSPRDIPDNNNEIKDNLVALETEVLGIAQKVYDEQKLNVSRYLAVESEIIQYFRNILLLSNEETKGETEGSLNKVVIAFRKLNSRIGDVCYGRYDPYGYCSAFSADVFFTKAEGIKSTIRFLLDEFKDDRYIKDPYHSVKYIPNLVNLYKTTSQSFIELGNRGTKHWLNGNRRNAMAEFDAVKSDLERLTTIMQQYNLL